MVCFDKRLGYLDGGEQEAVIEKVIEANRTIFYLSGLLKFSLPIYKYVLTPKWRKVVQAEDIVVRYSVWFCVVVIPVMKQNALKF